MLVVDIGGDDNYFGSVGSTPSLEIPVSLTVDLQGDDKYINEDEFLPSQGAAIFGAAMLLDVSGKDEYKSKRLSQGAAMLGIGILADMEGDDTYDMWTSGQGGAYFGIGLAIDNKGDDKYITATGESTNLGRKEQNISKSHNYGDMNIVHNSPDSVSIHYLQSDQICFFADISGNDSYLKRNYFLCLQKK